MRKFRFILAGASLLSLAACGGGSGDDGNEIVLQIPQPGTGFFAAFSPAAGVVPFPTDILFSGSTDGTLNIPVADPTNFGDPTVAINALDGFSTVAPITTTFSTAIDVASLSTPGAVRVFEATGSASGVTGITRELAAGSEYVATVSPADVAQTTLVIVPLQPLQAKTTYVIALTDSIKGTDGSSAVPDVIYVFTQIPDPIVSSSGGSLVAAITDAEAQALEPLRQLVNAQEAALTGAGVDTDSLILSWTVSTQSIDDVLQAVKSTVVPQAAAIGSAGLSTGDLGLGLPGIADIYVGSMTMPYYLDATAPYSGFWQGVSGSNLTRYNPMPVVNQTVNIPLTITVPNTGSGFNKPAAGWPVVIYQHGITRNRTDVVTVADGFAAAGFAVVAIDLPLHGLVDSTSPFYTTIERTFDLDVANNASGAPGADGQIDPSGAAFINLQSLLTSRDNGRQAAADLMHLDATLASMDIDADSAPDFDVSKRGFVMHSLGAMLGTIFLGTSGDTGPATLGMPGGAIPYLLSGSGSFSSVLNGGLAAVDIFPGTPQYAQFLAAAQTVIDSGDPINYAAAAAASNPIHFIEVVGGAGVLPDQTVPNSVEGAPLAGSEPLIRTMGLPAVSSTSAGSGAVRFTEGDHGSLISPAGSQAATVEMQTQMVNFIASGGAQIVITNPSVIQQ